MTQGELAKLCDTNSVTISQYENGVKNPKIVALKKIAIALDVNLSLFVDVEEDEDSILSRIFGANANQIQNQRSINFQFSGYT